MKIRFPLILDITKKLLILAEIRWRLVEGDGWGGTLCLPRSASIALSGWWFGRSHSRQQTGLWSENYSRWRIGFLDLEFVRVDFDGKWSPPGVAITEREMPWPSQPSEPSTSEQS